MDELTLVIKQLLQKSEKSKVAKDYVNPTAGFMLNYAGHEVQTMENVLWKAGDSVDNYNAYFAEFQRNKVFTGLPAKEQVDLMLDNSGFANKYQRIFGDSNIIPFDYWAGIPEQLVDTQRISGGTPQDNATVAANRLNWAAIFSDEMYVFHFERQYNLPIEVIRQYLYDPAFETKLETTIVTEIGNDISRLAVNGVGVDYASQNFYKLLKSWYIVLKEAKGVKTLPSGISRYLGAFGHYVTPVKLNADGMVVVTPLNDAFATNTSAKYTQTTNAGSPTLTVTGGELVWDTVGTGVSGTLIYNDLVPVKMNTNYKFSVYAKYATAAASITLVVYDPAGNIIASGSASALTTSMVLKTLNFNTYSNLAVRLKITMTCTATAVIKFDDFKLSRLSTSKFEYTDMPDIMDAMIDNYPIEYPDEVGLRFQMSRQDAVLFAKSQRLPVYITQNGQLVGMPTETREDRMEQGQNINQLQYRGYPIEVLPYAVSINKTKNSIPGYIVFGPMDSEYRVSAQRLYSYERLYKARMTAGGEGYEYTYHYYLTFGVRNPGKFVIAEGTGSTLACEDLTITKSLTRVRYDDRIGSSVSDITYDLSDNLFGYLICDTPGAEIYYSTTTGNLDSYDLAVNNATLYNNENLTTLAGWTNGVTMYVRAFLGTVTSPCTKLAVTIQT